MGFNSGFKGLIVRLKCVLQNVGRLSSGQQAQYIFLGGFSCVVTEILIGV